MEGLTGNNLLAAAFATTIGSNLGANITPFGSLAGIMWLSILTTKNFRITFREFAFYGLLITPVTLLASLGVLGLEFYFM
jgi:Na+/H+ antiporter NhaD/arsenite permease-like protein